MYKSNRLSKTLKIILYIIMIVMVAFLCLTALKLTKNQIGLSVFFLNIIISGIVIFVIFLIKNIVNSVIAGNPFEIKNIKYLKYIGYSISTLAGIDLLSNINNFSGTMVISIKPLFAIHFSFYVWLAFGLLALVLSKVFKQGYNLKEKYESDIDE